MFDEKFFLAISFFIFAGILIKLVGPKITNALDNKSKAIADELAAAKETKEKAIKLLDEAEKYQKESSSYAKKLLKDAESEAKQFLIDAQKSIAEELDKKTAAAQTRIQHAEKGALQDIKNSIISTALKEIETNAESGLNKQESDYILEKATEGFKETA